MGLVWTVLYLSEDPLTQDRIAERSGLSAGAVSMTLNELQTWGVVHRRMVPRDRRRFYAAETDVAQMVRYVLRERELQLVDRCVRRLTRALELLRTAQASANSEDRARVEKMMERLEDMLALAQMGRRILQGFIAAEKPDLRPIRRFLSAGSLQGIRRRVSRRGAPI